VAPGNKSSVSLEHTLALVRCPSLGPLFIGVLFGGIPFGMFLVHLGLTDSWGNQFFNWLTPLAVFIAALGAILPVNGSPVRLLWRAFLASLSACVPVPTITWAVLAWRSGFEILDPRNLPYAVTLFVLWTLAVTVLGWLLALSYALLKNRYARAGRAQEPK
jgi:hypothetical protein